MKKPVQYQTAEGQPISQADWARDAGRRYAARKAIRMGVGTLREVDETFRKPGEEIKPVDFDHILQQELQKMNASTAQMNVPQDTLLPA